LQASEAVLPSLPRSETVWRSLAGRLGASDLGATFHYCWLTDPSRPNRHIICTCVKARLIECHNVFRCLCFIDSSSCESSSISQLFMLRFRSSVTNRPESLRSTSKGFRETPAYSRFRKQENARDLGTEADGSNAAA
jgi:hypothetical protein